MMELKIMIVLVIMSFKLLPLPDELNSSQVREVLLRTPGEDRGGDGEVRRKGCRFGAGRLTIPYALHLEYVYR
ncbi:hypothetical protein F5X96DRAFT_617986 [Biscogniauxia mediterranea]|nr:hypothetical protein F5X96DRAFT_617986 [Biscogniauxia mediterranea]